MGFFKDVASFFGFGEEEEPRGQTVVNVPGPSAAELELTRTQTEILGQNRELALEQARVSNLLQPFLFEESGITPQLNTINPETGELTDPDQPEGAIISFEKTPDSLAGLRKDIEEGFLERTQQALAGNLPVNPALERELETGETELNERLLRQLGTGFETSSPGQEALDRFFRSSEELREGARRGDLSLAEQLGLAREQSNQGRTDALLNRIAGVSNLGSSNINQGLQLAGGFGQAAGQLASDRALQLQGNIATSQSRSAAQAARAQTLGSLFGAVGTAGGIFAGSKSGASFLGI